MPLAAILAGLIILDLAFRGTEHEFATALAADFGQGSRFWSWAAAIGIIGALGYVDSLRRVSTLMLGLVIVVMVLRNGGLFAQLGAVIANPPKAAAAVPISSYKSSSSSSSSGGGSTVSELSTVAQYAALFA